MGVVHKLKPEVLNFILENKQSNPVLSCRNLTQLVLDKFQIKVSKSSINAIFKGNNLSMPVGRRQKQKKKKFNMPALPVIEGIKEIGLIEDLRKPTQEQGTCSDEIATATKGQPGDASRIALFQNTGKTIAKIVTKKEEVIEEQEKEKVSLEEARIKEAEEWARKLQEEERIRIDEKLKLEKQRLKDEDTKIKAEEAEVRAHLEEVARLKAEDEARKRALEEAHQAAVENKRLEEEAKKAAEEKAAQEAAEENKRLEEAKKIEEEKATQEAELRAEKEKWAKLAEEELKAKQEATEEVSIPKNKFTMTSNILPQDRDCSGAILLKALDCLIGGSKEINKDICNKLGNQPEKFLSLTEAVIFRSLFSEDNLSALWSLIGEQHSREKLDNYYTAIKQVANIKLDIAGIISNVFTEARVVKVYFIDGSIVYLDGRMYSTWTTPYVPYDFSNVVSVLKDSLNRYFFQSHPLVLFSAPGYDVPSKEFFNLLLNIGSTDKCPGSLILYDNKVEEIESMTLSQENNCSLIFGLWPWQFTGCRKVKRIGDFNLKHVEGIEKDLYLAEIEIDLFQASLNQSLTLKGCAVKTNLQEKILLAIVGSDSKPVSLDKLAEEYLSRWPNFEETFQDFSRKIELFAYASNTQKFFPTDKLNPETIESTWELDEVFASYIKMLDAYVRWHFLPVSYIENDFSFTNEHFYKSPVKLVTGQGKMTAKMQIRPGGQFLKDFEYLRRRINERQIRLANGLLFCFENAFK